MFEGDCACSTTLCGSEGIDTLAGLGQFAAQPAKLSKMLIALIAKALFSFFMLLLHLRQQGVYGLRRYLGLLTKARIQRCQVLILRSPVNRRSRSNAQRYSTQCSQ